MTVDKKDLDKGQGKENAGLFDVVVEYHFLRSLQSPTVGGRCVMLHLYSVWCVDCGLLLPGSVVAAAPGGGCWLCCWPPMAAWGEASALCSDRVPTVLQGQGKSPALFRESHCPVQGKSPALFKALRVWKKKNQLSSLKIAEFWLHLLNWKKHTVIPWLWE